MPCDMSKIGKSKQKQSGEDKTQVVQNELKYSDFPHLEKASKCELLQYFSYQSISRVVTETKTGN